MTDLRAAEIRPMLATPGDRPSSRAGWLYELKIDGYRLIAERRGGRARLFSRRGLDLTDAYPEVAAAVAALPAREAILDGEVTVLDARGQPSFQRLQRRAGLSRPRDVARAVAELPATYFAFDLLGLEGRDLRALPLSRRKALLRRALAHAAPAVRYLDHVETHGAELYREVTGRGLEGVVGKRADSPYQAGVRSRDWIKWRAVRSGDFVVVGYSDPRGGRQGLGALQLAEYEGPRLVYRGAVGTGFSEALLERLRAALEPEALPRPPCEGPVPRVRGLHWVRPTRVAEVRYQERTSEGLLRQPVFLRLRDDKAPEECRTFPPTQAGEENSTQAEEERSMPAEPPRVRLTNLDKPFWPEDGHT